MRVKERHIEYDVKHISLEKADYIGDYMIRLTFDDHKIQEVDFESFLLQSKHPSIRKYLDAKLFKDFSIVNGNLNWGDYELIFPLSELYDGKINY